MNACCPPFTTPCEACDEAEVRILALKYSFVWRRVASHCGIHPEDFARFLGGVASLTHENRKRIRERLL